MFWEILKILILSLIICGQYEYLMAKDIGEKPNIVIIMADDMVNIVENILYS